MSRFIVGLVGVFAPLAAQAAPYQVRFCIDHHTYFTDNDIGEDYVLNDADLNARGIQIRVFRNSDDAVFYYDYAQVSGAYAGCTPTLNLYGSSFTVRAYARAEIPSDDPSLPNRISSRFNVGSLWYIGSYNVATTYVPPVGSLTNPVTVTFDLPADPQFNVLAIAEEALWRNDGGLVGKTFEFHVDPDPEAALNFTGEYINLGGIAWRKKYLAIHEMGHAIATFANVNDPSGNAAAAASYRAPEQDCGTEFDDGELNNDQICGDPVNESYPYCSAHSMNEREYQSAAFWEGWAHFYAAVSFNEPTQADCMFRYYANVDWDLDRINDDAWFTCAGSPATNIAAGDYVQNDCPNTYTNKCTATPPQLCYDTDDNRGTEYDWLRFFWAMRSSQAISFDKLVEVVDRSNPGSWRDDDDDFWFPLKPYPAAALQTGANAAGIGGTWSTLAPHHGADH